MKEMNFNIHNDNLEQIQYKKYCRFPFDEKLMCNKQVNRFIKR